MAKGRKKSCGLRKTQMRVQVLGEEGFGLRGIRELTKTGRFFDRLSSYSLFVLGIVLGITFLGNEKGLVEMT